MAIITYCLKCRRGRFVSPNGLEYVGRVLRILFLFHAWFLDLVAHCCPTHVPSLVSEEIGQVHVDFNGNLGGVVKNRAICVVYRLWNSHALWIIVFGGNLEGDVCRRPSIGVGAIFVGLVWIYDRFRHIQCPLVRDSKAVQRAKDDGQSPCPAL